MNLYRIKIFTVLSSLPSHELKLFESLFYSTDRQTAFKSALGFMSQNMQYDVLSMRIICEDMN